MDLKSPVSQHSLTYPTNVTGWCHLAERQHWFLGHFGKQLDSEAAEGLFDMALALGAFEQHVTLFFGTPDDSQRPEIVSPEAFLRRLNLLPLYDIGVVHVAASLSESFNALAPDVSIAVLNTTALRQRMSASDRVVIR
jgi:sulfur relay (sulfurtransferase) DsrF/TusC family protein